MASAVCSTAASASAHRLHTQRGAAAAAAATRRKAMASPMVSGPQRPLRNSPFAGITRARKLSNVVAAAAASSDAAAAEASPIAASREVARQLEFMVEMACGKCVTRVEAAVAEVPGVDSVVASLGTNTVRVVASKVTADEVSAAIVAAGYKCRLIGQSSVDVVFGEDLAKRLGTDLRTLKQSLAAVAEFKGELYGHGTTVGVVRLVQVDEDTVLIEGSLDGLTPGPHAIAIHAYGDTTRGVASVGEVYDVEREEAGEAQGAKGEQLIKDSFVLDASCDEMGYVGVDGSGDGDEAGIGKKFANASVDEVYDAKKGGAKAEGAKTEGFAGLLGVIVADANGHAAIPSRVIDGRVKVWDIIGRSIGVHAGSTVTQPGEFNDSFGGVDASCDLDGNCYVGLDGSGDGDEAGVGSGSFDQTAGRQPQQVIGAAAVLARSAGVGENFKKLCECDGTVIWEAGEDFAPVMVSQVKGPMSGGAEGVSVSGRG